MRAHAPVLASLAALATLFGVAGPAQAGRPRTPLHENVGHLTFTSPQVNPLALSPNGALLLVANTTSNTVEAFNTSNNVKQKIILVGIDPVSVAFRPDGLEAWVANHVSDSVSVIDTDSTSASYLQVVETIQAFDAGGATQLDEPVGIAFASNTKAFVALSSSNRIAIVDGPSYAVTGSIAVRAQEPRAIAVANGRLYVAAFESGNQSELSACQNVINNNPQCTLALADLITFAQNPNVPGTRKNIVLDLQVPDRDVFVYDAATNAELKTASGVGTLLYGLVVNGSDQVYVTQTDARNDVNGVTGSENSGSLNTVGRTDPNGDGDVNLEDLSNRMFTNELALLSCGGGGSTCSVTSTVNLDGTGHADALATPYGIAISGNGATLVATAAGTNRLFTLNAAGAVQARFPVGAIPRGVALRSDGSGVAQTAYVLNTLDNTVSVVNVTNPAAPSLVTTINVGADPTPPEVRRGAIAFNSAFASNTGNFSCGSCHPDGNMDQLLWRIGGECFLGGCVPREDEPRSTMPIRGLRDTLPLHWDGTLGDPFGGPDGSVGSGGNTGADCAAGNQHACFRDLVDGSLSGVMCARDANNACNMVGPSGLPGLLTTQEREDMASFLEMVSYPPARMRRIDDSVSQSGQGVTISNPANPAQFANVAAAEGFKDFFMNKGGLVGDPDTCADSDAGCHELPLGTGTNSETLQAFDVPTMRGMTDRFLQFSLGPTNPEEMLVAANAGQAFPPVAGLEAPIRWEPTTGHREVTTFGAAFTIFQPVYGTRPLDMFQMFEEASTGPSGATGRQVTLNTRTTNGGLLAATQALLEDLEEADARGVVNLRGIGLSNGAPITISYLAGPAVYQAGAVQITRASLISQAQAGTLLATLTAHLRAAVDELVPQPLIASVGAQCNAASTGTGDPGLPFGTAFTIEGKYVVATDRVFMDGQPLASATLGVAAGASCASNTGLMTHTLSVNLGTTPANGMHLLQIQSGNGLLSNELPFCVGAANTCNN